MRKIIGMMTLCRWSKYLRKKHDSKGENWVCIIGVERPLLRLYHFFVFTLNAYRIVSNHF